MMRSVFSGVTGLQAHQVKMDIIGNNIANVNTVGFKSSRCLFQEVFNETIRGPSGPEQATGRGGTNPMQVGLGLGVGSIDMINTRGTIQRTENPTDVAIDGEGYFIVRTESLNDYRYTRAGNFNIDKNGNFVTTNGMKVQGWQSFNLNADGTFSMDTGKPIEDLNFYSDEINGNKRVKAAEATTEAYISGNLDASAVSKGTANATMDADLTGVDRTAGEYVTISSIEPETARNADKYLNTDDYLIYTYDATTESWGSAASPVDGTLYIDNSSGKAYRYTAATATTSTSLDEEFSPDFVMPMTVHDSLGTEYSLKIALYKNFSDPTAPNGITTDYYWTVLDPSGATMTNTTSGYLGFDENGKCVQNVAAPSSSDPTITISPESTIGSTAFTVDLDFSKCTMYSGTSNLMPTSINGYKSGNLVSFNIGVDGVILGIYSNGQRQPIGMLALGTFENPGGLKREGDNVFMQTSNSGEMNLPTPPGNNGAGLLTPGALEMSNVDLSKEFTEMIVTQRGFQANSRIITSSDEMLQELLNIKR